ncbi:MAG: alpha/beta hydrolase [Clostridia bacterium]|nr:alpha/beta hydrolase [Clostridia bacterium]
MNDKKKPSDLRALRLILPAATMLLTALLSIFFNRTVLLCPAIAVLAAADLVLRLRAAKMSGGKPVTGILDAVIILSQAVALIRGAFYPTLLSCIVSLVCGAVLLFLTLYETPAKKKGVRAAGCVFSLVFLLVCVFPVAIDINPDLFFRYGMQGDVMSHETKTAESTREDGVRVLTDVVYPSEYPNNTMNIFLAPENRGTMFYIHGGGFVIGDKDWEKQNAYLEKWIENGYNVVSIDYALAPQYRIEAQIRQCGGALAYFVENAGKYGVDPNKIVLLGDSAGGCLSGLLTAANASPDCATALGLEPAENGVKVRGWISISGLLDVDRTGKTNNDLKSWGFQLMVISGLHKTAYVGSPLAKKTSVLTWLSADFPPCYISDGNNGTFTDQARDAVERLTELGVKVESNFIPPEKAQLPHIWELDVDGNGLAAENFEKTLAFVNKIMK